MSVSQEQQTRSTEFVAHLHTLISIIDDWTDHIPEGEYLKSMDTLKDLFEFKTDVDGSPLPLTVNDMTNTTIREHVSRATMRIRPDRRNRTDAEKLATGQFHVCHRCDRIIKTCNQRKHLNTKVCWKIFRSKGLTKDTAKRTTCRFETIITRITGAVLKDYNPRMQKVWGIGNEYD